MSVAIILVQCATSQWQLRLHPDYVYHLFNGQIRLLQTDQHSDLYQWFPKCAPWIPRDLQPVATGYISVMATFKCTHFFNYMNNVLTKIIKELNQLVLCLFQMTIRISNYETFCTHKASNNHLIKVKLCKTLLLTLPVCIFIYLKSVLRYIFFNFGYLSSGHYIYMSEDVRIRNYFLKTQGVYETQHFWNTDQYVVFVTIFIHKVDTNIMYLYFGRNQRLNKP